MPLVSVIVPVYNVEKYIGCCVQSILAQTFSDFELILVDDGSTDQSGAICDAYAAKDSRVVVIHKENGGVSSARNLGLNQASGEYITFVDSDDWLDSEFLRIGIDECISRSLDIYCSGATRVLPDGSQQDSLISQTVSGFADQLPQEDLTDLLHKNYVASSCGKLIRKKIIADLRFDSSMNWGEDLKWVFTLLKKHIRIYAVPTVDYYYRVGDTNSAGSVNLKKCRSFVETYHILYGEITRRAYSAGVYQNFIDWRCFSDLLFLEQLVLNGNSSVMGKYKMLAVLFAIRKIMPEIREEKLLRHLQIYGRCPLLLLVRKCI